MNAAAAAALYEAERKGVRQITGLLFDGRGGMCAGGVIIDTLLGREVYEATDWVPSIAAKRLADMDYQEWCRMVDMNNKDGLTFSEIARKLGPDSV